LRAVPSGFTQNGGRIGYSERTPFGAQDMHTGIHNQLEVIRGGKGYSPSPIFRW
jgi:hypothetical protein